jgi:deaminated glutathione amidase
VNSENTLVAAIQMTSGADVTTNLARAGELVRKAVERGARLVVLPENVALMGAEDAKLTHAEHFEPLKPPTGPIGKFASELSRELGVCVIWGGVPETAESNRVYNTSACYDVYGNLSARYRKIHLFDVALPDGTTHTESRSVAPGDECIAVDTPAGRVGMSICYDIRFPELYRRLVTLGARVITVPAAFTVRTGRDHWHVLLRARAIESQCYVIAAAQWGSHGGGRTTYGHALIVDPWGTILSECHDGEGFALAEVLPSRIDAIRTSLPSLAHRRLTEF